MNMCMKYVPVQVLTIILRLRYTDHQAMWNSGIQTNIIETQNGGSGKKKGKYNMRILRLKPVF